MKNEVKMILSFYPNNRGLVFICLEKPHKIIESGVMGVRVFSTDRILYRISKFVEFYSPTIIVIRDCEIANSRSSERIQKLVRSVTEHAKKIEVPVHAYSRQQVKDVFEQFGATNKFEIARKIITWFPELEERAPKIRKSWMNEEYSMGVFDTLALAITHQYLSE